jgi:hypothetical protein
MSKTIFARIMQGLRQLGINAGGEIPTSNRLHYYAMNPATGKMVRKTVPNARSREKRKKSR